MNEAEIRKIFTDVIAEDRAKTMAFAAELVPGVSLPMARYGEPMHPSKLKLKSVEMAFSASEDFEPIVQTLERAQAIFSFLICDVSAELDG